MNQEQLFILGVIGFIVVLLIGIKIYNDIQLKKMVTLAQGRFPRVIPGKDREKSLKEALMASEEDKKEGFVDDLTWSDLDGYAIFQMINQTFSSIGAEKLYKRLRQSFGKDQDKLENIIAYFKEHPKEKVEAQWYFAQLGKKDHNFVESYLKNPKSQEIGNPFMYLALGLLPLISIILIFIIGGTGVLLLIASILFNVVYYFRKKNILETELASMGYLVQTIHCAKSMQKIKQPTQEEIKQNLKPLEKITKFAFSFAAKSNSEADMFMEYLNMIFLMPFISYNFVVKILGKHQEEAKNLWELLGDVESAGAILNFREVMPYTCQPQFVKDMALKGRDVYHPLLKEPVSNNLSWEKNTLVTGSNASGKSTYVKSVAISCLLAQSINTALAQSFSMPQALVMSSMALEDNIFEGESYFVAEIKSVKRIIEKVKAGVPVLCFIDEILKGTNTIERIAASSSIVSWLSEKNLLSFVATHDIELTEILKDKCDNVHFSETVGENGVFFDYKLKQGPSKTRNALALLKVMNYPSEIVDKAKEEASYFEKNKAWKTLEE